MVKSMTGFGKITIENGNRKVVIEIKSLNSKTLDLNLKMPNLYKEKEMEIRNIVKEQLDRGKVEMCIYFDNTESDKDVTINKPVVTQYFNQLLDIANELGIEADKNKILQTVMRFPDTLQIKSEELEDTEWEALEAGIKKALEEINKFRIQEGKALIKDICHRIELIQELSAQVPQFEVKRVEVIRQKLQEKINEWTDIPVSYTHLDVYKRQVLQPMISILKRKRKSYTVQPIRQSNVSVATHKPAGCHPGIYG